MMVVINYCIDEMTYWTAKIVGKRCGKKGKTSSRTIGESRTVVTINLPSTKPQNFSLITKQDGLCYSRKPLNE